ncbi:MAG: 2-succinyl-5-enolpyruvyl-6-hydroxy-3-cyclohexene-1-carboxylate synthase [Chitinophagales bacterium]|nr:MAG: 2-succinyl-5-enolpyruvyl-6-hydroxy-3-cyclohexene-1-carboxylate synthase [Chitinophagales bacterium]
MLNTDKIWIRDIAEICAAHGMDKAVISPGSRSAPLVIAFSRQPEIECIPIVDERAAAFFALGMAQQTAKPVALICTSGSATLNFAPALAEAYYQRIPLITFTADRPDEFVDQRDGQTIRQRNIYSNYIRKSFHLPVNCSAEVDRWYAARIISEAIHHTQYPVAGPVHVNVPLREPLHKLAHYTAYQKPRIIRLVKNRFILPAEQQKELLHIWSASTKKMLLIGSNPPDRRLQRLIKKLAVDPSVSILTETTSNITTEGIVRCIDPTLEAIDKKQYSAFSPQVLVTLGGEIISRKVKAFLRSHPPAEHWHIDPAADTADTFQCLTRLVPVDAPTFLQLLTAAAPVHSDYRSRWTHAYQQAQKIRTRTLASSPYCDLTVFGELFKHLPSGCNLHLGNSSPIRYSNLFELHPDITVNCNRGVSGIDGVTSTAAGAAYVNKKLTVLITGDLSFFYDSNALWNKALPANLRIIVINNAGGNIFRIIPGPSELDEFEPLFEAPHELTAEYLAKTFNLPYYFCDNMHQLQQQVKSFFRPSPKAAILEIKTPAHTSAEVLKNYMNMK